MWKWTADQNLLAFHHASIRRDAHAGAHGAGRLVGRQVQPPVPERRQIPQLKRVDVDVDLLPERRVATIENAWTAYTRSRVPATMCR